MKLIHNIALLTSLALMTACGHAAHEHNHEAEEHDHAAEGMHGHEEHNHGDAAEADEHALDEIIFTKAKADAAGLQLETVHPAPFRQVLRTGGQLLAAQGDEQTVVATADGIVNFTEGTLVNGSMVRKGAVMVHISAKTLAETDPTVQARINYEAAQSEYERAKGLSADKIVSDKELEQTRLRYETAKSAYEALAGKSCGEGVEVLAPMSGYVKNVLVSNGDYVQVGQPLATVTQNRRLQLRADVSERQLAKIGSIAGANFVPAYSTEVYALSAMNGRLLSVAKTLNGNYIPIMFEFDNVGNLVSGAYAEVYLLGTEQPAVLTVPMEAITEEQGLYFVYLQLDEEGYRKQEVHLGMSDGQRVVILNGLHEGDRVAVAGVMQLKLAANSGVIPEGHSHNH